MALVTWVIGIITNRRESLLCSSTAWFRVRRNLDAKQFDNLERRRRSGGRTIVCLRFSSRAMSVASTSLFDQPNGVNQRGRLMSFCESSLRVIICAVSAPLRTSIRTEIKCQYMQVKYSGSHFFYLDSRSNLRSLYRQNL